MSKIKRTPGHAPMAFCLLLAISRPVLIMSQTTLPITASPVPTASSVPPPTDAPITAAPVVSTAAPVVSTSTPTGEPINTDSPTPAPFVTEEPTDAPVTSEPTDAPVTDSPTPAPVTDSPTPATVTDSPTPATVTDSPTPAPMTSEPTAAPVTGTPTVAPVTASPTAAPVKVTTAPTTSAPTSPAPTTAAPTTSAPTTAASTTSAPTTSAPTTSAPTTSAPTNSPTSAPTSSSPTSAPTKSPTNLPTATPSLEPTALPTTLNPTGTPSVSPSTTDTASPTSSPSSTPSTLPKETEIPSLSPSLTEPITTPAPTKAPSSEESTAPTTKVDKTTSGVSVTLNGVCVVESPEKWSNETTEFYAKQYMASDRMTNSTVEVTFTSQQSNCGGRRNTRGLQANSVEVTYEQALAYSTSDSSLTLDEALELPLSTQPQQDEYVAALKQLDGYSDLTSVSPISVPPTPTIAPVPNPESGGGVPQWAIIIIIVIGVLALVVLFLIVLRKRRATRNAEGYVQDEPTYEQSGLGSSSGIPGLGDETVETMDYDYAKAYGGMGDASLSEAGGTMGSRAAPQAEGTIFSDDPTFNEHYDGGVEEVVDVYAPAGKLGVVIDTPNEDAPVVHAVKDTSPIADQVRVGDKLVAVDDEDVRAMTAIKVSKLISKKSTQESRKLTLIRHVGNS